MPRIGRMTYEGRYVIITAPDGWREGDPLPPADPTDKWFDKLPEFLAALDGPWDRVPIKRQPWVEPSNTIPFRRPAKPL